MCITMSIIHRTLSFEPTYKFIPLIRNKKIFNDTLLKGVLIWTETNIPFNDYAIIIKNSDFWNICNKQRDFFDGYSLICIGYPYDRLLINNCDAIFIPDDTDIIKLSNTLQIMVRQFYEWGETLSDLSNNATNLSHLLNASVPILNMEMLIVDKEYNYAAYTKGFLEHNASWTGLGQATPLDSVNALLLDNRFADTFKNTDVFEYASLPIHGPLLCYNMFYNNEYIARLLAQFPDKEASQGDIQLVRFIGKAIEEIYKRYHDSLENSSTIQFHSLLRNIIEGGIPDTESRISFLSYRGWKAEHTYQIVKFQLNASKSSGLSLPYFCMQIEKIFKECSSVITPEGIYCVRNITLGDSTRKFLDKLPYFLRDSFCKAGISNEFSNFYDLQIFSVEADTALIIGEGKDSMLWYYCFKDYSFTYLKNQCLKEFPFDQICHPAINTLIDHDKKEHSELCKTLRIYLEEKYNGSHAADKLFIHRTTFLYRMKKIEELTGIDFENIEERAYLILSFLLMEQDWE